VTFLPPLTRLEAVLVAAADLGYFTEQHPIIACILVSVCLCF